MIIDFVFLHGSTEHGAMSATLESPGVLGLLRSRNHEVKDDDGISDPPSAARLIITSAAGISSLRIPYFHDWMPLELGC